MKRFLLIASLSLLPSMAEEGYIPGAPGKRDFDSYARDFIEFHCFDCHGDGMSKGDLSLEELGAVDETNIDLWKSIWAQVSIQEMPPKKQDQPEVLERIEFTDWIVSEMERVMKDKGGFHTHKDPQKGNFIAHDLLYGELPKGIKLKPTASPKRIWRLTPDEHITRLNDLINTEPKYDPEKPGQRTHGDSVPRNHGGELKLYFGVDRITYWSGGTVAYATAVKAIPVVFSSAKSHGLRNYAHFSSVNSAEATQILTKANDILRYMAYGPESLIKHPEQITDDPAEYWHKVPRGDDRGLPSAITYSTKMVRPTNPLYDLFKEGKPTYSDDNITEIIYYLFRMLAFRPPSAEELDSYLGLTRDTMKSIGEKDGLFMGLSAIFLDRDALFRPELAEGEKPDDHGRVMLQDRELGLALNHALSYIKPDEKLEQAIITGKMRTREDVRREISRMLNDDSIRKPRVLQFFREYFDYDLAGKICKDEKALRSAGMNANSTAFRRNMQLMTASTDRLVEHILATDKDVLRELLTTQKIVTTQQEALFHGRSLVGTKKKELKVNTDNSPQRDTGQEREKVEEDEESTEDAEGGSRVNFKAIFNDSSLPIEERKQAFRDFAQMKSVFMRSSPKVKVRGGKRGRIEVPSFSGDQVHARTGYYSFGKQSLFPQRLLTTAPKEQRLGLLTSPAWLISHSDAMDNHAIHRGIWIRKKLLGGGIPDVPITVDAQLPDEPNTPLRDRMRVTREKYCWSCHDKMDPLGLTFEMYNHVGNYRTEELGKPVDTSGAIIDSGVPGLDGPVKDAHELINKLANSEHVEQVFIRHAFRFWMGRNETIHDRQVLQDAHKAYKESGGSMKALIAALVTSDAFLFRQ